MLSCGCVNTPRLDTISGVKPKTVIDVIACELIEARQKFPRLQYRNSRDEYWVAVADLTFQVDEQLTLAPSFTHTDVVSKELTRAFDWGLKFDTQAQRIYNESVFFPVGELKTCDHRAGSGISLNGKLGLVEVIDLAFGSIDEHEKELIRFNVDEKKKSVFGTQLQFVVVRNVNSAGPTWSLANFRGPGKLFTAQRGDTHKLSISFALGNKQNPGAAVDRAKNNNLLLLQQSLPSTIINQLKQ